MTDHVSDQENKYKPKKNIFNLIVGFLLLLAAANDGYLYWTTATPAQPSFYLLLVGGLYLLRLGFAPLEN